MNKYISYRHRSGRVSFLFEKRALTVGWILCSVSALLLLIGLSVGSTLLNPLDVLLYLTGLGAKEHGFILGTLRLPRMLVALLAGAALGVSGLILQGMIRNPLGSPDILGITGGASLAAVTFITYLSGTLSIRWLPFFAIAGAGLTFALIYMLAWKKGLSPIRIVLVGIGIAAGMGSLTTMMLVFGNAYSTSQAYVWMTGSVYGANWGHVTALLPWVLIFIPLSLFFSKAANAQQMGEGVAIGLGIPLQRHRSILFVISVALAGSAVAYAGGIGFIGLIAPHIARKLVGSSFGSLVPISAIIGGLIVAIADVIGRTAFIPLDLPAGVFVSGIGAPFFIYLLFKSRY